MTGRNSAPPRTPFAVLALALALTLTGCAMFKASTRLDVSPFAQNTVGMIGEVQRAAKPVQWVYLKKYESLPSVVYVRQAARPAQDLMRGVALYSTQIVSIYESPMDDQHRAEQLARYLDESVRERIVGNAAKEVFVSPSDLDAAVANVRKSTSFLGALGAAQPVVSSALAYGNTLYDSLDVRIGAAAVEISRNIETEFAPTKREMETLDGLELRATHSYSLLAQYRNGDAAALDSLRALDPESAEAMPKGKKPSAAQLDAAQKRLLDRVDTANGLKEKLGAQMQVYQAEQMELDALRNQANEAARLGRITLILWARSHRNLSDGITVPAQIDVMGIVKQAANQAKNAAF